MCLCGEENKVKGKDLANTDATLNDLFPIKKKNISRVYMNKHAL